MTVAYQLGGNERFYVNALVSIKSLLTTNNVMNVILVTDLESPYLDKLIYEINKFKTEATDLLLYPVDEHHELTEEFRKYVDHSNHKYMSNLKYFTIPIYLPKVISELGLSTDRVLSLDADLIFVDSIDDYYYQDLRGIPLVGMKEVDYYPHKCPYINGGMMLLHISEFVKYNPSEYSVMKSTFDEYGPFVNNEQCYLSYLMRDKIKITESQEFNMRLSTASKNPSYIPFVYHHQGCWCSRSWSYELDMYGLTVDGVFKSNTLVKEFLISFWKIANRIPYVANYILNHEHRFDKSLYYKYKLDKV